MSETADELRARLGGVATEKPWRPYAIAVAFVDAWPAIDAMFARLTEVEAERDEARTRLATKEAWIEMWVVNDEKVVLDRLTAAEAEHEILLNANYDATSLIVADAPGAALKVLTDARAQLAALRDPS